MGLIKAIKGAASGVLADQWKEYFYCEAIPADVLMTKGVKRTSSKSSNTKGSDNIISNGSTIAVADGQCMIIVDQGKVAELCAEPGEFVYDSSSEPSIFDGGKLGDNIKEVFANIGKRFTYGGQPAKDQRIYYFNTKEIIGNKYGTPSSVPFKVIVGQTPLTVNLRCFGEYSYKVSNPILFYTNICGNVSASYKRDQIDSQLKTELLTALQPAFAKISASNIDYTELPGHTMEIADALNEVLTAKWKNIRGIEIVSFGISSVKAEEEDEKTIKELQRNAAFKDPAMAAAQMVGATSAAMQAAASNTNGAAMAFMGMNMAQQAGGVNTQNLYQMAAQQQTAAQQAAPAQAAPAADAWTCPSCNKPVSGNFCPECGTKKPVTSGWVCPSCGNANKGKFCTECGTKKPTGALQYKCDKCGWEPADPTKPPKFCPQCGDPFGDEDIVSK